MSRASVLLLALAVACGNAAAPVRAPSSPSATPPRSSSPSPFAPTNVAIPPGGVYAEDTKMDPRVRDLPARVYVPNPTANRVDVIDPSTYSVVARFAVGKQPQHVTPSWDLSRLYVDEVNAGALGVIDPASGTLARTIGGVRDPYNLYFTPDGTRAIVVCERLRVLDFRDPGTWKLLRSLPVPFKGIDHLDFSADGRFALISAEFSGMIATIDVRSMRVTGSLRVGGRPIDVKLSPDGSVFFVANQGTMGVSVIDAATLRELAFIPTALGAHGMAISRDGKLVYVGNRLAGSISVLDPARRRVVDTWSVGGSPDMLQVSPDGRELWASNRFHGSVSVIDTRTGKVTHLIRLGGEPHGLTYFPQPGRFSIGHNGVYR